MWTTGITVDGMPSLVLSREPRVEVMEEYKNNPRSNCKILILNGQVIPCVLPNSSISEEYNPAPNNVQMF